MFLSNDQAYELAPTRIGIYLSSLILIRLIDSGSSKDSNTIKHRAAGNLSLYFL